MSNVCLPLSAETTLRHFSSRPHLPAHTSPGDSHQCPLALMPKTIFQSFAFPLPFLSAYDGPGALHTFPISLEKRKLSHGGGITKQQKLLSFILAQFTWHLIIAGPILKTIICSAKFSAFIATRQVVTQDRALLIKCFKVISLATTARS